MTVDVYKRYYAAKAEINGVPRRGALVLLIADSAEGRIRYEAAVSFFPHREETDFSISYDAYHSTVLYEAAGRRSKKREEKLLASLPAEIDRLAAQAGGEVLWDRPLREERRG